MSTCLHLSIRANLAELPTNRTGPETDSAKGTKDIQSSVSQEKAAFGESVLGPLSQQPALDCMDTTVLSPSIQTPVTRLLDGHHEVLQKITALVPFEDEEEEIRQPVISQTFIQPMDEDDALALHPACGMTFAPTQEGARLSVTLPGDSVSWLAIENRFVVMSLIRKDFYELKVVGKVFPWVGDLFNLKYTKSSIVQIAPGSRFRGLDGAGIVVHGMVPIPVCLTEGHPTMIKCLVVDELFPGVPCGAPIEMVIGADYFINTQIGTASLPKSPTWHLRNIIPRKPAAVRIQNGIMAIDICEHMQLPFGQNFNPVEREFRKRSVGKSHDPNARLTQAQKDEIVRKVQDLEARLALEGREGDGASIHQGLSIAFAYQSCLNRSMDLTTAGKLLTFIASSAGTRYCNEMAYYVHDRRDLVCAGLAIYYALRLRSKNGFYFETLKINTTSSILVDDMTKNVQTWHRSNYCLPNGDPIPARAMYAFLVEYARLENITVLYALVGKSEACQKVACYLTTKANELALDGAVYKTDMGDLTEKDKLKQKTMLSKNGHRAIVIENGGCQLLDAPLGLRFKTYEFRIPICEYGKAHLRKKVEELGKSTGVDNSSPALGNIKASIDQELPSVALALPH
ncbi:hypothetical protein BJ508DRAFT_300603 [Ascobolus immersus RN42]|uniref:Uncharacterized protein n=1 Tax=Ascobolus immersus RN42 TaxID=1160509 RepID=A0A3N4IQM9_ASCIM|nr:hypothetical protein BJ508DRAFT_300603 [Ascobolus immersus RN42]